MLVEVITPEASVFKGEAEAIQLPGLDGSFQILKGHAPIISALSHGDLKINLAQNFETSETTSPLITVDSSKVIRVSIKGGVVEMLNDKVVVLAE